MENCGEIRLPFFSLVNYFFSAAALHHRVVVSVIMFYVIGLWLQISTVMDPTTKMNLNLGGFSNSFCFNVPNSSLDKLTTLRLPTLTPFLCLYKGTSLFIIILYNIGWGIKTPTTKDGVVRVSLSLVNFDDGEKNLNAVC